MRARSCSQSLLLSHLRASAEVEMIFSWFSQKELPVLLGILGPKEILGALAHRISEESHERVKFLIQT